MENKLILVQNLIYEIRGRKVMLDSDLAKLYQIETKQFELTLEEHKALIINMRSQFVTTSNNPNTHTRYAPFAFTEQGVAMLSSVLKSDIAIQVNIAIMRAFVQVREHLLTTTSLSAELKELRAKVDLIQCQQEEDLGALNDLSEEVRKDIDNLYVAIGQLAARLEEKKNEPRKRIGY